MNWPFNHHLDAPLTGISKVTHNIVEMKATLNWQGKLRAQGRRRNELPIRRCRVLGSLGFSGIYDKTIAVLEETLYLLTLKQSPRQFHMGVVMNQHKQCVRVLFYPSHKNFKLGLNLIVQTNNIFLCSLISCPIFLQTQVYKDTCQEEKKSLSFHIHIYISEIN